MMQLSLHANATTTPKTRAYIQSSDKSVIELSEELGVNPSTIYRWRKRETVTDRSHTRHNLGQSTNLEQEALITSLRQDIGLSIDDITEVMNRCLAIHLTSSSVGRCLRRLHINKGPLKAETTNAVKPFEPTTFGYVHIDLKQLTKLNGKLSYIFVAIERTTRFVYVQMIARKDRASVKQCLEGFLKAFTYPVHTILTDNGSEFTDRFSDDMKGKTKGKPSGKHPFDLICKQHGIKHKLTRPYRPQTNGMVERFNRRLAEAIRSARPYRKAKNRFETHQQRNEFVLGFVHSYNRTRLRCLKYKSPLEILANHTGDNTTREREPHQ
jgi:IS30 family transposase